MRKLIPFLLCLLFIKMPVSALEFEAPEVPYAARKYMPNQNNVFSEGLVQILKKTIRVIHPDIKQAVSISETIIVLVLILSILTSFSGTTKEAAELAGCVGVATILLQSTGAMIDLAANTIQTLSDYGKLLLPVMTGALAAQGGMTTSTGLCLGTTFFDTLLGNILSVIFLPGVFVFLAVAIAAAASGEEMLNRISEMIKNSIAWCLKILMTVFTSYMSITGVISGSTDAAALKATKVTISTIVPVVGGILSDASETILVSAGLMKNTAGIYGIFAVLAIFLDPFLRIGTHYLMLKMTGQLCGIFGSKKITGLIGDFSGAMGILLALTGSMCLLILISTVCFLKGAGS